MRDPDDILIDDLSAPPPLEVCRDALAFWQRRRASLPWTRRAARRDAAAMIVKWEQRVREAERAKRESWGVLGLLYALVVDWPAALLRRLPSRRRMWLIGGSVIACLLAMAILCVALTYAVLSGV